MNYEPLELGFYVILGFAALAVALMILKLAYRNLPLWLFELWPHAAGLALGAVLLWKVSWQAGLVAAGVGLALGMAWTSYLERCRRLGREQSSVERVHWRLIKWAQR
jgi:hypothetical protein